MQRTDDQLEAVRRRWVERYKRTAHALAVMGLSVGSSRRDMQERYEALRALGATAPRDLEDAYRYLSRVLPAAERRNRKRPQGAAATTPPAMETGDTVLAATDTVEVTDGVFDLEPDADDSYDGAAAEDDSYEGAGSEDDVDEGDFGHDEPDDDDGSELSTAADGRAGGVERHEDAGLGEPFEG